MHLTHNLGMILLAIWLIVTGLLSLSSSGLGVIMAILAIAAGVLILLDR
jgi:multisubunit Na+/H+ antiporter MnhE subunit